MNLPSPATLLRATALTAAALVIIGIVKNVLPADLKAKAEQLGL